jgi:hypothetical protein
VTQQWNKKCDISIATVMHATLQELKDSVLSGSMPIVTSYNRRGGLSAIETWYEHWNIKINEYKDSGHLLFS